VVKREYLTRVGTKGFIIFTIAVPLFSAGLLIFTMMVMLATRESDHTLKIALLDNAGFAKIIAAGLTEKLKNGQPVFRLVRTLEQPQSEQKARDELADQVRQGLLDCYLVVVKEVLEKGVVEFHPGTPLIFKQPVLSGARLIVL
jgi:ABC-type Na+ efflux pump permease subunit